MSVGKKAIAKSATNKKTRKVGPLSAKDACHSPNTPIMERNATAMLWTMIPVRRGGRKINTSLTRGIIVEFDICKHSARRVKLDGYYLM
jgi:hypothetical protein